MDQKEKIKKQISGEIKEIGAREFTKNGKPIRRITISDGRSNFKVKCYLGKVEFEFKVGDKINWEVTEGEFKGNKYYQGAAWDACLSVNLEDEGFTYPEDTNLDDSIIKMLEELALDVDKLKQKLLSSKSK